MPPQAYGLLNCSPSTCMSLVMLLHQYLEAPTILSKVEKYASKTKEERRRLQIEETFSSRHRHTAQREVGRSYPTGYNWLHGEAKPI